MMGYENRSGAYQVGSDMRSTVKNLMNRISGRSSARLE